MKKITWIFILLFCANLVNGQSKFYVTTNYEIIFSLAATEFGSYGTTDVLRFAPWYNIQSEYNFDLNNTFGLLTGIGIRNIGFIYDVPKPG